MSTPQVSGMHPLLSSVVHRSFRNAAKQVGCCELSFQAFRFSLEQHLSEHPELAPVGEIDKNQLWLGMINGEVLAVEYLNNEAFLFHVRGKVLTDYVDMRFYYHKDKWEVRAVTSIHRLPFWKSRWRAVSEVAAGTVMVLAIVGLLVHSHSHYTKQGVESWAQDNGYQLVNAKTVADSIVAAGSQPVGGNTTESSSASTQNTPSNGGSSNSTTGTASTSAGAVPQKYSFNFKSGMAVHAISAFLAQHHLVSNAYAFDSVLHKDGIEKSIWPGTYVFKSNMNQNQIIAVLKNKP